MRYILKAIKTGQIPKYYLCVISNPKTRFDMKRQNILASLLASLLLSACATHRQTANLHREKTFLHDSLKIFETTGHIELRFSRLAANADSVAWCLEADSLVTQAGDRIFRPRLRRTTHAPAVSRLDSSATQSVLKREKATASTKTAEAASQADTILKAKAEPFPTLAIVAAIAILVAALMIWKRKSSRA